MGAVRATTLTIIQSTTIYPAATRHHGGCFGVVIAVFIVIAIRRVAITRTSTAQILVITSTIIITVIMMLVIVAVIVMIRVAMIAVRIVVEAIPAAAMTKL
jgi:hypothetical protein